MKKIIDIMTVIIVQLKKLIVEFVLIKIAFL